MQNNKLKYHAINQSRFYRLKSKKKLANILGITYQDMISLSNDDNNFYEFTLSTKSGKVRDIETPKPQIKHIHKRITNLLSRINPGDYLYCPVKGRSYIDNAYQHKDANSLVTLDIKNYFPSTKGISIYEFFKNTMECSPDVSYLLSRICECNRHLPTGSSISPILAYFAHRPMWERIAAMAAENGCRLTVYMDDLAISGQHVSHALIWKIKIEIKNAGLTYHKEERFEGRRAKIVTGVIIKDGKLKLPNRQHKKIYESRRAIAKLTGEALKTEKLVLKGRLSQAKQIIGHEAKKI